MKAGEPHIVGSMPPRRTSVFENTARFREKLARLTKLAAVFFVLAAVIPGCKLDDPPPLEPVCGDTRGVITIDPAGIVNGTTRWDETVVQLNDAQALSIGAIMFYDRDGWSNGCTGTLVDRHVVLTAAHCVYDSETRGADVVSAGQIRFAIGLDVANPTVTFEVAEVHPHSGYDTSEWNTSAEADVAVLILRDDALELAPSLQLIPYNCDPLESTGLVNRRVQVVGYGLTDPEWGASNNTQRWWTTEEVVNLSSIDFLVDGHGQSAVCMGDSGGPALWTMPGSEEVRILGTLSWGDPSCLDQDHFARVDDNCSFLAGYVGQCRSITTAGKCMQGRAVYCQNGAVVDEDCSARGEFCGPDGSGGFRCLAVDPCTGIDAGGRCEGNNAVWCDGGQLRMRRCAECGQGCAMSDDHGGSYCI